MPEYDLTYLKRKKRKKAVLAIMLIACTCAVILALVAILARNPGAFTVNLKKGSAAVSISQKEEFTYEEGTGYLTTPKLPGNGYKQATYEELLAKGVFSIMDNEGIATAEPEGEDKTIPYFKYTFFIKNFGSTNAEYDITLKMTTVGYNTKNEYGLDATLRVACMENRDLSKHNVEFYAMRSTKNVAYKSDGTVEYLPEYLSQPSNGLFATPFLSNNVVLKRTIKDFQPDEVIRYTFLFWIEGHDPESVGTPPDNTLRMEAAIDVREASVSTPITSSGQD